MKKFTLFSLLLMILISCKTGNKEPGYTIINTQLSNTTGGSFVLTNLKGFEHIINVRDDGTFTDTLDIEEGAYYAVYDKIGMQLYLEGGSTVKIVADAGDFNNTVQFEGIYSDLNKYYGYKEKIRQEFQENFKTNYSLDETAFVNLVDSIQNLLQVNFKQVPNVPEKIRPLEENAIGYFSQGLLQDYPDYHSYLTGTGDYKPSADFTNRLTDFGYDKVEDFFYSRDYNIKLLIGIMRKGSELTETDTTLSQGDAEFKVLAQLENDTIRESLMYSFAAMNLALMEAERRQGYYTKYIELSADTAFQAKISDLYKSLSRLDKGNPSPVFTGYENYAGGTVSLADFKGKYVYIDVWATWCGPCKAEIPYLAEIEKQYHGKNIEFVSISVDNKTDKQTWKDMIAEKKMGGVQLFADDTFNSAFIKDYQIRGIPQFILLDPQGNIVDSQAPRPSEKEKLTELFNNLQL